MGAHEPSSLDRFLWGRGQELLDPRWLRGDVSGLLTAGGLQLAIGLALIATGSFSGNGPHYVLLATGLALALVGAGVLSLARRRMIARQSWPVPLQPLSNDGQRLLHKICCHIGYYNWQDEPYGRSLTGLRGVRTSSQVLPDDLFGLMDRAAFQFNRIDGLLKERSSSIDKSLKALEPNVRAACYESMSIVVNHASWIDTFPENKDDHRRTIEQKTEKLQELADRLSALVGSRPTLTEAVTARTVMDDVLDRIGQEEEARRELAPESVIMRL